jgi:hypothetical protein
MHISLWSKLIRKDAGLLVESISLGSPINSSILTRGRNRSTTETGEKIHVTPDVEVSHKEKKVSGPHMVLGLAYQLFRPKIPSGPIGHHPSWPLPALSVVIIISVQFRSIHGCFLMMLLCGRVQGRGRLERPSRGNNAYEVIEIGLLFFFWKKK